ENRKPLEILLTAIDGQLTLVPGQHSGVFKVAASDVPGSELLIASPFLITDITRTYRSEEIEEFESLINCSRTSERQLQKFFEAHPKFLLGQEYESIHPQILLEREHDGPLIPDFLLKPFDHGFCDILDLKLPRDPIIVGQHNRERFSAAIYEAAAQLRRYRDYFEEDHHRTQL